MSENTFQRDDPDHDERPPAAATPLPWPEGDSDVRPESEGDDIQRSIERAAWIGAIDGA